MCYKGGRGGTVIGIESAGMAKDGQRSDATGIEADHPIRKTILRKMVDKQHDLKCKKREPKRYMSDNAQRLRI